MNKQSKTVLEHRLERLEAALSKEDERIKRVINNIGWGTGMRCTKCTPSFRRYDELRDNIQVVKSLLGK